jgi:hypothetical protein
MGEVNLPHIEVMFKENLGERTWRGAALSYGRSSGLLAGGSRKQPLMHLFYQLAKRRLQNV